jgi:hypothetical protein
VRPGSGATPELRTETARAFSAGPQAHGLGSGAATGARRDRWWRACQHGSVPVVESRRIVPVEPAVAFAISQTQGDIRKRWGPFIARQHLLGGAGAPAGG